MSLANPEGRAQGGEERGADAAARPNPPLQGAAGVLFDLEGTLFLPRRDAGELAERMIHALAHGDGRLERALAERGGYDLSSGACLKGSLIGAGSAADLARRWAEALPLWEADELETWIEMERASLAGLGAPAVVSDLPRLLDRLIAHGLTLGVATHAPEGVARTRLEKANALERFSFVAGFDSGFAPKPDAAMLRGFCAATGLAPGGVVVIGDAPLDLAMARAGGALAAIGVLSGGAAPEALAEADLILPSIADAPDALGAAKPPPRRQPV
ncbi:MAG: HAD family hydrolase [Pseudomonadota bacterium]